MPGSVSSQVAFNTTIFVSFIVLLMGLWVSFSRKNETKFRNFGVIVSICFLWVVSIAFFNRAESAELKGYAHWFIYASGMALPVALLSFACSWCGIGKRFGRLLPAAFFLVGLSLACLGPIGVVRSAGGQVVIAPWLFFLYLVPVTAALLVLMTGVRKTRGRSSSMAAVMFGKILMVNAAFSILFTGSLVDSINLWVPLAFFISGLAVMTLFLGDLKLLVDLRFVAAEALVLVVLFIFVSDLVGTATQSVELAFRMVILLALAGLAGLMTYNLVRNMKRMHENEVLRERMRKLSGRLIEADRNKTKFVAFVAHQLQSPLSGVHIYLDMARKGEFGNIDPELDKVLADNIEVIDGLLKINQTFLDVTKIDLGRVELVKDTTDLVELVNKAIEEMKPRAAQKGLTLSIDSPFSQFLVKCDPTYIHHALINLVDNAVKYTESGSIRVSIVKDVDSVKVLVADTGCGLAEADFDRLFGVFRRGMLAVDLEAKGEGLGLYIVKQFVEAHGGEVFFDSPGKGQGSTFGFVLRLEP